MQDHERHFRVRITSLIGLHWYIFSVSENDVIQLTDKKDFCKAFVKLDEAERCGALKIEQEKERGALATYETEMI